MGWPIAERVAIDVLARLGHPVYVIPPRGAAAPYFRVTRVGGTTGNIVTDNALVMVSAYAADPADAAAMATAAREAFTAARCTWVGSAWVRWWQEAAGPALYPDPESKLSRYQFTGQLDLATNIA